MIDCVSCGLGLSSLPAGRVSSGVGEVIDLVSSDSWESVELYAEKRDVRGCTVVARVLVEKRGCIVIARVLAEKRDMSGCALLGGKAGRGRSEVEVLVLWR